MTGIVNNARLGWVGGATTTKLTNYEQINTCTSKLREAIHTHCVKVNVDLTLGEVGI